MDNLEEVLQALDEFQKMRPTVIPQELEDYLCWVAKTGDPVYQWSLIKTLFREKLTRVMTDFYENCPTLELAPCPNVEHFNYDTMKSNLLERLESFANAPFTVQRICELLTAPRKEYNRVDKFMRAIEKNILVVSTREPGPIARRGETGDGMMNGSVEEDTASITQQQPPPPPPSPSPSQSQPLATQALSQSSQTTQPVQQTSQDVEMEYWEKDCNSTVTISVHTVENEPPLLHSSVMPTAGSPLAKNVFSADENSREKLEQAVSRTEIAAPSYASTASDFSTISHLASQTHEPVSTVPAGLVVHSLPTVATVSSDTSVGNTNVTEAIINENTNSQSNLELENEDVEATKLATVATTAMTTTTATTTTPSTTSTSASTTTVTVVATVIPLTTDTTRKLQAAFQAKRYESDDGDKCLDKSDEKSSDSSTADNPEEGIEHSVKSEESTSTKTNSEYIHSDEMSRDESRLNESLLQTDAEMRSDTLANNVGSVAEERISDKSEEETTSILEEINEENLHSKSDEDTKTAVSVDSQSVAKKDSTITLNDGATAVIVSSNEALFKSEKIDTFSKEESVSTKESFVHDQSVNQNTENADGTDKASEILRLVSSSNNNRQEEVRDPEINSDNLKMTEISNDKTALVESMESEPMSVVEKPKEVMSVIEKLDLVTPNVEMAENLDNGNCSSPKEDKLGTSVQDDNLETMESNQATACIKENQSSVIECRKDQDPMELMEVEEEESLSTQDESMEQETTEDLPKS
ncbi:serine/threonine-protein phosphatase 4 regulatory subunit 2 [Pseudomyrmex gracilis]|uniref:serine/threonine-protein phosphatase 4 regulatory subunit 2 n=1 Tax=Pseudomyrmex gracilis TaxID=219809 RepID=UPI000994DE16|nr:serine/threonine-protein phosphatase 4 regulatory subunit 2 [Pseudomyrmex gracilis]